MQTGKILGGSVLAAILGLVCCVVNEDATTGTKCLKDTDLRDYPVNVYYCDDPTYTVCCQRDYTYDCCEDESKKNWREQLILWGCVTAGIVLVLVVCLFFWKEDLLDACCKKCRRNRNAKKYNDKTPLADSEEVGQTTPVRGTQYPGGGGAETDSGRGSVSSGASSLRSQKQQQEAVKA